MHRLKEIFIALAALLTAGLMTGCVYDDYSAETPLPEEEDNRQFVSLFINVGMASPTRADAPAGELMHSLRIILVDAVKNQIEYNTFIGGLENATEWSSQGPNGVWVFRTEPGAKKIFFIANEDCTSNVNGAAGSLTALLNGVRPDDNGTDFENKISNAYFTPDFDKGLVLSSSYEFTVDTSDKTHTDENNVYTPDTFYLVHNATKFEFRFENYRESDVTIEELTLSALAGADGKAGEGDMYLMANLDESEKTKKAPDGTEKYWIYWLYDVCRDTTATPELPGNATINENYGWIAKYALPSTAAEHNPLDIKAKLDSSVSSWTIPAGNNNTLNLPIFYASESRYNVNNEDGLQQYTFDIKLKDAAGIEKDFNDQELKNLKALFRNTHVIVTATVTGKEEEMELRLKIGICPWDEETIVIPPFD